MKSCFSASALSTLSSSLPTRTCQPSATFPGALGRIENRIRDSQALVWSHIFVLTMDRVMDDGESQELFRRVSKSFLVVS
jgi:hypothetical protein